MAVGASSYIGAYAHLDTAECSPVHAHVAPIVHAEFRSHSYPATNKSHSAPSAMAPCTAQHDKRASESLVMLLSQANFSNPDVCDSAS